MDKSFRGLLRVLATVMVVAGASTVLLGADSITGVSDPSPAVDSEMRFFAVWYVAAGVMLLRSTRDLQTGAFVIRIVGGAFFVAGCARALSWASVGRPPTLAIVLMAIEFLLSLVIAIWIRAAQVPD